MTEATSVSAGPSTMVLSSLGPWAEAWDELVAAAPLPTPFSRAWWLEHVPVHRPRFVLVVDGGELVGGLALEERVVAGISFVTMLGAGPLCPDHLDLLARPGQQDLATAHVRTWLSRTNARVVRLDGLVEGALVLDAFPEGSSAVEATAPWVPLANTEAYLASRSKNFRSNIRKMSHRADRDGVRYRRLGPTETSSGLIRLRELHFARWGDTRFLSSFDRFAQAAMRGAEFGEVSLHELVADGAAVAFVVCFELAGRIFFYQAGRRPEHRWRSAGTLLLFRIMEHANERGFSEFDLLRGDEPYKLSFADAQRPLLTARSNWGLGGKAAGMATGAVRRARSLGAGTKRQIARRISATQVAG
jgi:CelD/BcsL family acetyltransferase involved in cellulose biosynthesis